MEFIDSPSYRNISGFRNINGCTIVGTNAAPFLAGQNNNVFGFSAMVNTINGDDNTVIGKECAYNTNNMNRCLYIGNHVAFNASGNENVVMGHASCLNSRVINNNICIGAQTAQNSNGAKNVLIGVSSDFNGINNILVGASNLSSTDNCIIIGNGITSSRPNQLIIGGQNITDVQIGKFVSFGATSAFKVSNGLEVTGSTPSYIRTPLFVSHNVDVSGILSAPKLVVGGHWTMTTQNNDLLFLSNNNTAAYFNDHFEPGVLNFTGQHRCVTAAALGPELIGMVVRSTGCYKNLDGGNEPCMNESIPIVEVCTTKNDPTVFGVVGGLKSDFKIGNLVFNPQVSADIRVVVNSVGEGAMWVCDEGGPLKNGDLISSSSLPGYGSRQDGDIVRSYTIAKITSDCDFKAGNKALVGVVYKC